MLTKENSQPVKSAGCFTVSVLQDCFNHRKCKFLLSRGRIFPELFYFLDFADFIFSQFVLQQIVRRNMKRLADVDEYWQAGHFGPALNLAEICGVDVAQFRKFFRC